MTTIKTAVSIEESLFHRAEEMAREMQVSRSRLFALALENYVAQYHSRKITEILNEVYADGPTAEEEETLEAMRRYQAKLWKDEPW
jgi:metal-responsive CopG/Arc/MetJ family transcriptional regulator